MLGLRQKNDISKYIIPDSVNVWININLQVTPEVYSRSKGARREFEKESTTIKKTLQ